MATNDELSMDETIGGKALDPASFDLAAWIDGVQPVTRAVTIYARGDLVADLDLLVERARLAKAAKRFDEVRELQAKAGQIVDEINASALDVVVQAWSQDRIDGFRKELEGQGLDATEVSMRQVAAQVVSPAGFTVDMLATLFDRVGPQAQQIVGAVSSANASVPTVSVPF